MCGKPLYQYYLVKVLFYFLTVKDPYKDVISTVSDRFKLEN